MNLTQSVCLEPISNFKLKILGKVDCLNIRKIEKFLSNQTDPTNEGKVIKPNFHFLQKKKFDDLEIKRSKYWTVYRPIKK